MESINERIRKLRECLGLSQEEFGEKIGITRSSISGIESGRRMPSEQTKAFICSTFSVRHDWLEGCGGEMFEPSSTSEIEALRKKYGMSDFDLLVVRTFAEMAPEQRRVLYEFIQKLAASLPEEADGSSRPEDLHALLDAELEAQKKVAGESTSSNSSDGSETRGAG